MSHFFITGTDTNIGKTYVSLCMLRYFNQRGYSTIGMKPLASGCIRKNNILYNEDALALYDASSIQLEYNQINPFAFEPAIAPHIAAEQVGVKLTAASIVEKIHYALHFPADIHLIEGVGGWLAPLNDRETMADVVLHCQLPVIMVVGMRVGCLNHALLTYQAIMNSGANLVGWIANFYDPTIVAADKIIATLNAWLKIPCLSIIAYQQKIYEPLIIDVSPDENACTVPSFNFNNKWPC